MMRRMRDRLNTYIAYSIGCAVVWAVLLTAVAAGATTATLHVILLVFAGWVIGWISDCSICLSAAKVSASAVAQA